MWRSQKPSSQSKLRGNIPQLPSSSASNTETQWVNKVEYDKLQAVNAQLKEQLMQYEQQQAADDESETHIHHEPKMLWHFAIPLNTLLSGLTRYIVLLGFIAIGLAIPGEQETYISLALVVGVTTLINEVLEMVAAEWLPKHWRFIGHPNAFRFFWNPLAMRIFLWFGASILGAITIHFPSIWIPINGGPHPIVITNSWGLFGLSMLVCEVVGFADWNVPVAVEHLIEKILKK